MIEMQFDADEVRDIIIPALEAFRPDDPFGTLRPMAIEIAQELYAEMEGEDD